MNELKHIAIIMDGNGRWATRQGLKRVKGHEVGSQRVRDITKYCSKIGVKFLTLYAFSTENWKRPKMEVDFLMRLLDRWLKKELNTFLENNIRFTTIGDISKFSIKLQNRIKKTKELTKDLTGLTQVLAINYGGKDEIVRAIKKVKLHEINSLNEEKFTNFLDTANMPNVDLLIRTGGEKRLSNFLLWQSAYAELCFIDTLWPDFKEPDIKKIIDGFYKIERRFGGV